MSTSSAPRRVSSASHGRRAQAARWVLAASHLAAIAASSEARAADPGLAQTVSVAPPESASGNHQPHTLGERSGFSFDLRLGAGLASVAYDEGDRPIADFDAFALGGAMRLGGFLDPHVVVGAELAVIWGSSVGDVQVRDPSFFGADERPGSPAYGSISPLGVFVEVYPWESEGLFFGAAAGIGFVQLPRFGDETKGGVMARYALELGYELGRTGKHGPALYLRHERWAGTEDPIAEDHPAGLVSRELLAGLRWSFWSDVWHPER